MQRPLGSWTNINISVDMDAVGATLYDSLAAEHTEL